MITLTIESVQFLTSIGSFDIDDFILNISGGMLSLVLYKKFLSGSFDKVLFSNFKINENFYLMIMIILAVIIAIMDVKMVMKIVELESVKNSNSYVRGLKADRQDIFKIEDYTIYIDKLLVVFKDENAEMCEVGSSCEEKELIQNLLNNTDFIKENDEYSHYKGLDVNMYVCKNIKKLIFSNGEYKNEYCE